MDFKNDIINYLKSEFEYLGVNYSQSKDINNDLLNLFTLQRKIIFPIPRKVEISKELKSKVNSSYKHSEEIIRLKRLLEIGQNVNNHQSKNLFNYKVHDRLVYDWKIYHLHLSLEKKPSEYFTKRTKEVLFVYVSEDKALLIETYKHPPHDVFANKTLLEVLDRNWPDILLHATPDVIGLSHNPTQQERLKLRKHNLNEGMIEVNGKIVFAPGLGQTTSGHSVDEVNKLLYFKRWLKRNEKIIENNQDAVDKIFMKQYSLTDRPNYQIVFTKEGPQIWDSNSLICLVKYNCLVPGNFKD